MTAVCERSNLNTRLVAVIMKSLFAAGAGLTGVLPSTSPRLRRRAPSVTRWFLGGSSRFAVLQPFLCSGPLSNGSLPLVVLTDHLGNGGSIQWQRWLPLRFMKRRQ